MIKKNNLLFYLIIIMVVIIAVVVFLIWPSDENVGTGTVQVNDIDIAYQVRGEGYPLILVMGYSGTMDMWDDNLLDALAKHYQVITFDNRGMGESTASDQEFTIDLFADDTAELLDALEIKEANVLGWSMGTNIALDLALQYPDKVNKLVLYAADCGGKEAIFPPDEIMNKLTNTSGTQEEKDEILVELLFPENWLAENPDPAKYMPTITEKTSPQNIDRQTQAWQSWPGVCNRLNDISQPTLLVTGTEDLLTPPENSLMLVEKIPGAQLTQFQNAGHGLMFQYPEELSQLVITFLAD